MPRRWSRRLIPALTAAVVAASTIVLVPTGPAQAGPKPKPPTAQRYKAVPVAKDTRKKAPQAIDGTTTAAATAAKPAPVWPVAGAADATVAPGSRVRAGTLPVLLTGRKTGREKARVSLASRDQSTKAGVDGLMFTVNAPGGMTDLDVTVEYGAFATAYGADWASRLRLVALPARPGGQPVVLATKHDIKAKTVTATLTGVTAATTTVAATAGPSGGAGDFGATDLKASSTWGHSGSTGGFTWSYPIQAPAPASGPSPTLGLSYASQSVDGRNAASNNQPGPIGEGFDFGQAYIERRYKSCADELGKTSSRAGDLCWGTDNAILNMAGRSGELIKAGDGTWHLTSEDGSKIERLTSPVFSNGDNTNEYWRLTTASGVQYWFGRHQLPGWASGKATTNSVQTVQVYANSGTINGCAQGTYCTEGYRWNLDYVVDPRGNTMSYWYSEKTNKYARNKVYTAPVDYDRESYLTRIDYGTDNRDGTEYNGTAPNQIVINNVDRCLASCTTKNETTWPDTPWDLDCTVAPKTTNCLIGTPTFWSQMRVNSVTTRVAGADIDSWAFDQSFPNPGDGTRAGLWLKGIAYTGKHGGSAAYPSVTFAGIQMNNRVDSAGGDWALAMNWWRVADIKNETGGRTSVTYSPRDCVAGSRVPTALDNNSLRCYPVLWTPSGKTADITDYYHKYVVTDVVQYDNAGGNKPQLTHYDYLNPQNLPLWRHDDQDGLIPAAKKTWSQWRGYPTVVTTVGDTGEQSKTETLYYRGMNDDLLANGTKRSVTVTDRDGDSVVDHEAFAGQPREKITWAGSKIVEATVTDMWQSNPTATRTIGNSVVEARFTGPGTVRTRVGLDSGAWMRRKKQSSYDQYGMATQVADFGDETTGIDDLCTQIEYTRNTTAPTWLLTPVKRTHSWAGACSTAPSNRDQITDDTKYSYDNQANTGIPTRGEVTQTESISGFNGTTRTYVPESTVVYDAQGRPTDVTDLTGAKTHTDYTPAAGGPVTHTKVTNALLWTTDTDFNARGLPTKVTDTNNRITEVAYDAAGRTTDIWSPTYPRATFPTTPTSHYDYTLIKADGQSITDASVVTTKTLDGNGKYKTSYALYDGFARPRQTQATAFGGETPTEKIVTDTFYDSAGRLWKTNAAHPMTGLPTGKIKDGLSQDIDIPRQDLNQYDNAGRLSSTVALALQGEVLWRSTTTYHGDHVDQTPPAGGTATSTYYDARGRTVANREYHGGTPTGTYDQTTRQYDPSGALSSVKDAAGNTWSYSYDIRGRMTAANDPDHGATSTMFNAKDQIESDTDAEGRTVAYTYDVLGRRLTARDASTTGTVRAEWKYDTPYKGATASSTRYDGGNAYTTALITADAEYRPTQTRVTIPAKAGEEGLAGTFSTRYTYRADGSPNTVILPATADLGAETLTYVYDPMYAMPIGLKTNYTGATYYVNEATYTNLYQPSSIARSTSLLGDFVSTSQRYDEATGRVERRLIGRNVGKAVLADANIAYNAIGDITSIDDNSQSGHDTQCFQYDYQRRLTEAWTPTSSDCSALPTSAAKLGGPAPYWQSWRFGPTDDPKGRIGNRLKQIDHTTAGDAVTDYTYPGTGTARPHAVTTETRTDGNGTATYGYSYDKAGNTISRPGPNGQQALSWDAEGRLATVTDEKGDNSYLYDAEGNRLISRDPDGSTLELGTSQIRLPKDTGTAVATRYYSFGSETIAQRDRTGLRWLASDYQGTGLIAVTADAQQTLTQRRQTPYGEARGAAGVWVNPKGFLGGQADPTGLTHLGAREYDPGIGKFLSVDPILDFNAPAQWNAYAYAHNNPITFSDPTGLRVDGDRPGCAAGNGGSCNGYVNPDNGNPQDWKDDDGGDSPGTGNNDGNDTGVPRRFRTGDLI